MNIQTNVLPTTQPAAAGSRLLRAASRSFVLGADWAGDTAQKFAALLADLLSPAVFIAYAMMVWNLTNNFGWTQSFVFTSGPMANWLVWLALAILLNFASSILKRHTQSKH